MNDGRFIYLNRPPRKTFFPALERDAFRATTPGARVCLCPKS
jgi:hypothetical protein